MVEIIRTVIYLLNVPIETIHNASTTTMDIIVRSLLTMRR